MQTNASKHIWTCLSPKKTCGISPLEHQASGILEKYFLLEYSLPLEISFSPCGSNALSLLEVISFDMISLSDKLWCDLSLPLWHQFPRRVWSLSHSIKHLYKCDACRGQDSLSGAGSEETPNKWQTIFLVVKSVAPSSMRRLHRKNSVGPKTRDLCDLVQHREKLVTSAH